MNRTDVAPLRNRMAEATSPYLLQHANNPVHWQPWGEAAFAAAKERDVPVLLSIGYAACHWCHVMAHESFESQAVANALNAHFVCIKVDREERPDVDAVYMAVTTALNHGRGGWPMTVFLTPAKEAFFAGTYFPPNARGGSPGFMDLLRQVSHLWRTAQDELHQMAKQVTAAIQQEAPRAAQTLPSAAAAQTLMDNAVAAIERRFDTDEGGFTAAPKFPHTETLRFLMSQEPRSPTARMMVDATLEQMSRGGLYDVVGGGFSRYSVDASWHVPHFEKMLYDNALLAATYAEAAMAHQDQGYLPVVRATLNFALRELKDAQGCFYAAIDADSEGHEGRFYVWTYTQAKEVLEAHVSANEAAALLGKLSITQEGNWEHGVSIPRLARGRPGDDASVQQACSWLFEARSRRVRPITDTKILTGHNGMMLSALALGCRALSEPAFLDHACRAADALWAISASEDGTLSRLPRAAGIEPISGMLEDYAYLAEGLLHVYEAGGPQRQLNRCISLCHKMVDLFADQASGALYQTGRGHEALLFRPLESHDSATPSAYAAAVRVLLRAAAHSGDDALQHRATAALGAMIDAVEAMPHAHCQAFIALDQFFNPGFEAAFIGAAAPWQQPDTSLFAGLVGHYAPSRLLAHGLPDSSEPARPLLAHRPMHEGRNTVYLCREQTCSAPVTTLQALRCAQSHSEPSGS